jgi:hypothetical protein
LIGRVQRRGKIDAGAGFAARSAHQQVQSVSVDAGAFRGIGVRIAPESPGHRHQSVGVIGVEMREGAG